MGDIVADGTIGGFDEMSLGFGFNVELRNGIAIKGFGIAAVGVGADAGDGRNDRIYLTIDANGGRDALADDMSNNATLAPRISNPYGCPLRFF